MSDDLLLESRNFSVHRSTFKGDLGGTPKTIEYVEQPPVAIAIPILPDGRILLVEQWRPLLNLVLLECPGGKIDPGETIEEGLTRELSEEIGFEVSRLQPIGNYFSSVGTSTERIYAFAAWGTERLVRRAADEKRMTLKYVTRENLVQLLSEKVLADGKTQIALSAYFILLAGTENASASLAEPES